MYHSRSTTQKSSNSKKILAGFIAVYATAPAIAADQLSLSAGASLELHDNAPLHPDKESDLVRVANAQIGYKKSEGTVTADLDYSAERRDYLHNTQSDQNAINGNTELMWKAVPRQLDVLLYHQISQQLTDRRGADVSNNREERSIITAGVDGYLHFSPVDSLKLSPRFADVNFQHSTQANSQRSTMGATWEHKLSALSALDLVGNYDHVTFDADESDYNAPSVMLEYHAALARLSYQAGVGYNRIDRDEGKDFSGSTVKLGLDYKGESGFTGGGMFVHQLTDSSIGLSGLQLSNRNFRSNDSNFEQPDTIQKDQLDLYAEQRFGAASSARAGVGYLKEDYKETLNDQKVAYAQLGYTYDLNTFWSLAADAHFERSEFLDDPNDLRYNTTRLSATLTYKPVRALALSFSLEREKRNANIATSSYTDNAGIFGVQYRFY